MVLLRAGSRASGQDESLLRTHFAGCQNHSRSKALSGSDAPQKGDRPSAALLQRRNEGLTRSAYLELHYDVLSSLFYSSIPYNCTPLRLNFILYLFELVRLLNVELRAFKCGMKEGNAFH